MRDPPATAPPGPEQAAPEVLSLPRGPSSASNSTRLIFTPPLCTRGCYSVYHTLRLLSIYEKKKKTGMAARLLLHQGADVKAGWNFRRAPHGTVLRAQQICGIWHGTWVRLPHNSVLSLQHQKPWPQPGHATTLGPIPVISPGHTELEPRPPALPAQLWHPQPGRSPAARGAWTRCPCTQ